MEFTLVLICVAGLMPAASASLLQANAPPGLVPAAESAAHEDSVYVHDFEFVPEGEQDPAGVPGADGIVWYGTWEAAMAEKERTGKPVMLHMGSPRYPSSEGARVPGTW
jgi:streptogramin lyase